MKKGVRIPKTSITQKKTTVRKITARKDLTNEKIIKEFFITVKKFDLIIENLISSHPQLFKNLSK